MFSQLNYLQSTDGSDDQSARTSLKNIFSGKSYDKSFKVIIIGDQFTGKTALLMRIGDNKKIQNYDATIGVDCRSRTFLHGEGKDAVRVRLQIWDTAG